MTILFHSELKAHQKISHLANPVSTVKILARKPLIKLMTIQFIVIGVSIKNDDMIFTTLLWFHSKRVLCILLKFYRMPLIRRRCMSVQGNLESRKAWESVSDNDPPGYHLRHSW